ncbi:MAG: tyrosine recombinase XerC [Candidatus Sumerlaeota bacterium]|nr:tyrosine recombinase XerC [Candidatus Sumerlaeota bacterium]
MAKKDFHEALGEFETFLRVEKNLSERTRKAYRYDLSRFGDFLVELRKRTPNVDDIGAPEIRLYLQRMQIDRGCKSTTLSRIIASIRIFFEYCVRLGHLRASPAAHFHNPKKPKKLPVFLVEGELKKLLEAPGPSDWKGRRDNALLITFAFTGLRLQELVSLNLDNVDFERNTLRVFGKGAKERIVPMNQRVVEALNRYLAVRVFAETPALFLNYKLGRLSPRGIEKIVRQHALQANIATRKISPHKLRHTFATLLHHNGVDILEIQTLLGHASITSTQIYTHTSSERLAGAVKKLDGLPL